MACLHTPELVEVDLEAPVGIMPIGLLATPGISSVSSSHIVKDKITGVTYMDTITTSVGRVTISGPGLEAFPTSPIIEDITNYQIDSQPKTTIGQMNGHSPYSSKKEHS